MVSMHVRTVNDLNRCIAHNLGKIPPDTGHVLARSPGGLLAASLIAGHLRRPVTLLGPMVDEVSGSTSANHRAGYRGDGRRVLLVDDVRSAHDRSSPVGRHFDDREVTRLAVYAESRGPGGPGGPRGRGQGSEDLVLEVVPSPTVFEWSLFDTPLLDRMCLDIDGVLCVDPTKEENDDGERYLRFLETGTPMFIPSQPVMALVTNRLEKYRGPTESWLARHGIRYGSLIMMDLPDAATRTRSGAQAAHKADAYLASGAALFVESDPRLARQVAQLAGRRVLAFPDATVFDPTWHGAASYAFDRLKWRSRQLRRTPRTVAGRLRRSWQSRSSPP